MANERAEYAWLMDDPKIGRDEAIIDFYWQFKPRPDNRDEWWPLWIAFRAGWEAAGVYDRC